MTKQASIAYISGLMDNPSTLTDGDQGSIASFRQSFPYFVPARYLDTLEKHKDNPFSPAMLSAVMPYMGDWLLFCDFMNAGISGGFEKRDIPHNANGTPEGEANYAKTKYGWWDKVAEMNDATETSPKPVRAEDRVGSSSPISEELNVLVPEPSINEEVLEIASKAEQQLFAEPTIDTEKEEEEEEDIEVAQQELQDTPETKHDSFWIQADEDENEALQEEQADAVAEVEAEIEENTVQLAPQAELHAEVVVENTAVVEDIPAEAAKPQKEEKPLIYPVYTDDYFLQQGEKIPNELPREIDSLIQEENADEVAKSLMVMMSFSEWLLHFKNTAEKQKEETKDQRALKTMWQKEKLAAAIEEENEEIPENVFEMAVNSITKEDGLASESLAEIYIKQGKYDKAIDMYRKLSLRNPQKSPYFARKTEEILKEKQS